MTLPDFELVRPRSLEEAAYALRGDRGEALVLAGGTDLIPNMKNGLHAPERLVSLRNVRELREIRESDAGELLLGAGCTLATLATHPFVDARYPALAKAAASVGGPQIRGAATLGGNVCLDTRCAYYNQSEFWRSALGYCLKKDGDVCHVVPKGRTCVAALSADTPTALLTYCARARLVSASGERWVDLDAFYLNDGARNTVCSHDEIVTTIALPPPATGTFSSYYKLALRKAIDFPLLSVALALQKDEAGALTSIRVAVGAVGARPRLVRGIHDLCIGRVIGPDLVAEVAETAHRQCHPLLNVVANPGWRRDVLPTCVRRAFDELVPSMTTSGVK